MSDETFYLHSDIIAGITINDYRKSRKLARKGWLKRLLGL